MRDTDDEIKKVLKKRAQTMALVPFAQSLAREEYNAVTRFFGTTRGFWQSAQDENNPFSDEEK